MKKVGTCFYPQNIRRVARKFLSAQGASPEQWVNTSIRVLYLNLSDASMDNEKVYSVFLPSEHQARRPKVPSRSRRVARTVGEHLCTRLILEIYLTLRWAMRKVMAYFYPPNIRRAARKFLSAQGASPAQWVNTSVRFILEIYLTLRSAMRKVTACFYPQNIRGVARKFLSAQGASPEQWVNTSVRFILEIYMTLRWAMRKLTACFYPHEYQPRRRKFISAQGASPKQWAKTSVRFILGNLSDAQ